MLARETLDALLESIASDAPSPGSGVAAAISLALAIACLRKAVAISARHTPDEDSRFIAAAGRLSSLSGLALHAAEHDAREFAALLAAQRSKDRGQQSLVAGDLVALASQIERYCAQVQAEADTLADIVLPTMRNDVLAARELSAVAAVIVRANRTENRSQV